MKRTVTTLKKKLNKITDVKIRIHLLNQLSRKIEKNNPPKALELGKRSYMLAKKYGDEEGTAYSLLSMSYACRSMSQYYEAMPYLFESLMIFEKRYNQEGIIEVKNLIGIFYFYGGRYDTALEYFKKALILAQEINCAFFQLKILNNIGEIYREQRKNEAALEYYSQALKYILYEGLEVQKGVIYLNIGTVNQNLGNDSEALCYYEKSLECFKKRVSKLHEAESICRIGEIYQNRGEYKRAERFYLKSLRICSELANKYYIIDTLLNLGKLMLVQKKYIKAYEWIQQAFEAAEEIQAKKKMCNVQKLLSVFYERTKEFEKALYHYKIYHKLESEMKAEDLEKQLEIYKIEFKIRQFEKETETYKLKNIELKQKSQKLIREIKEREEIQEQLEKANSKLLELSSIDTLTNIPNRRKFEEEFNKKWNHGRITKCPMTLILIDVDYFKKFNDCYGHAEGDLCLKKVAATILKNIRTDKDFAARIGGEEFAVIADNTNSDAAETLAERIRNSVEALEILHQRSNVSQYVTISIGIASIIPTEEVSIKQLFNMSDTALYYSKKEGRNKVSLFKSK